jgi:hypothetical protein
MFEFHYSNELDSIMTRPAAAGAGTYTATHSVT